MRTLIWTCHTFIILEMPHSEFLTRVVIAALQLRTIKEAGNADIYLYHHQNVVGWVSGRSSR